MKLDTNGIEFFETLIFKLQQRLLVAKDTAADAIFAHDDNMIAGVALVGSGMTFKAMNKATKEVNIITSAIEMHTDTLTRCA